MKKVLCTRCELKYLYPSEASNYFFNERNNLIEALCNACSYISYRDYENLIEIDQAKYFNYQILK